MSPQLKEDSADESQSDRFKITNFIVYTVQSAGTDLNDGVTTRDAAALVWVLHHKYRSQELTDLNDGVTTQDTAALVWVLHHKYISQELTDLNDGVTTQDAAASAWVTNNETSTDHRHWP